VGPAEREATFESGVVRGAGFVVHAVATVYHTGDVLEVPGIGDIKFDLGC
jgi:hypothetical protein